MANVLDHVLVAVLVALSFVMVLYSLGPARLKKWMLAQVARYFGLRALLWVMPKQCGCDGCSAASGSVTQELKKTPKTQP